MPREEKWDDEKTGHEPTERAMKKCCRISKRNPYIRDRICRVPVQCGVLESVRVGRDVNGNTLDTRPRRCVLGPRLIEPTVRPASPSFSARGVRGGGPVLHLPASSQPAATQCYLRKYGGALRARARAHSRQGPWHIHDP